MSIMFSHCDPGYSATSLPDAPDSPEPIPRSEWVPRIGRLGEGQKEPGFIAC